MSTILIKNGEIFTGVEHFRGSILVKDGKIEFVSKETLSEDLAEEIIDAKGFPVFPGGIDPHVHMHLPTAAGYSADDFYSASKAALSGGTTTLIDFVTPQKGQSLQEALSERKKEAENALTDFSFHMSLVEWRDSLPDEIKAIKEEEGISSFKVYMAYKDTVGLGDEDLRKVLKAVADAGGMVTVHAEIGDEITALRKKFLAEGKTAPEFHPLSRPDWVEAQAVEKIIDFAREAECPLYIVHVSTEASLKYIIQAQKQNQKLYAETCPQYLLLDDDKYQGRFEETAPFVLSPPLRKKSNNKALWLALNEETIVSLGTDHCPFNRIQKEAGKNDFTKIANGIGGVEHRLTLLYTYGVLEGKLTMNEFVNLVSTNPAKIFGLYPQKGSIAVGSDADLVIWNPDKENTISVNNHVSNSNLEAYEGFETRGAPKYVFLRGQITVENGKLTNHKLKGEFLKRS
ncbi:MAG: dihydropyrimidinase [Bacteroidales bacterium]|nr:dihydropyrimidinase [Bacteroidales bacterium]